MQIFADMIENEAAKRLVEVPANATLKVTGVPGTAYHGGMRLIGADGKEIKTPIREVDLTTGYAWTTYGELVKLPLPLTVAPRDHHSREFDKRVAFREKEIREARQDAKLVREQEAYEAETARRKVREAQAAKL